MLAKSEIRRTTTKAGLWICSTAAQFGMEALAIGSALVNTMRLLGVKSGARTNRARLDKGRTSGHVDTSSHHLRKITKPERQFQPQHK